jgi:hypothetical protein
VISLVLVLAVCADPAALTKTGYSVVLVVSLVALIILLGPALPV